MERTNERFGSTRNQGERGRPIGGSYGYEQEALGYGPPRGQHEQQRGSRRRRGGILRRMASWVGSTLQDWADTGAEQLERAGERARELTEQGGSRAQRWADRGEHEARHWSRRAGARMERAGSRMESAGEDMRRFGRPEREYGAQWYGSGRSMPYGYGEQSFGYGQGREPYDFDQGLYGRDRFALQGGEESRGGFGYQGGMESGGGFGEQGRRRPFAGRGPRGYRRSDERIHEDVCDSLSSGIIDASDIEVKVDDGEVTLTGEVDRRDWKHIAEDMVSDVRGVRDIQNQVRVRREERTEESEPRTYHTESAQQPQH